MKRSDEIKDIAGALAKAQQAIEGAVKGNVNPAFRSKYADLGAVWDAIREPLTGHGISVLQQLTTEENRVACTTLLMHSSGQWIEFAPFVVPVSKQDAQGFGSAATYCRRYSLMAAVGIAPIDDDGNGNGAVGRSSIKAMPDAVEPAVPSMPAGLLEKAQSVALEGRARFTEYWKSVPVADREFLKPHMESLKAAMAAADAASVDEVGE